MHLLLLLHSSRKNINKTKCERARHDVIIIIFIKVIRKTSMNVDEQYKCTTERSRSVLLVTVEQRADNPTGACISPEGIFINLTWLFYKTLPRIRDKPK